MDGDSQQEKAADTMPAEAPQIADVFVALPHCGMIPTDAMGGLWMPSMRLTCAIEDVCSSALTRNFNALLLRFRKQPAGAKFFAMHHADISVAPGWIDTLVEELEKHGADVVSAVVPIKDPHGLTTTGVFSKDGNSLRRYTMSEVMRFPETFDASTARPVELTAEEKLFTPEALATKWPDTTGQALAINTGLWVMRADVPWLDKLVFKFEDEFVKGEDGEYTAVCRSEDWLFSEDLATFGAKVMATRKVRVRHWGTTAFGNDRPWGILKTDRYSRWR